jgi:predicted transcriptional regulator
LTLCVRGPYPWGMEVHFSPDKEARLRQFATRTGKDAAQLVEEAVDRMLEYEARFIEAVEEGRASARRGDLLEHDDVVKRIEQILRS